MLLHHTAFTETETNPQVSPHFLDFSEIISFIYSNSASGCERMKIRGSSSSPSRTKAVSFSWLSAMTIVTEMLLLLSSSSASSPPRAPALYVFGDSLLDSGNNNLLPTIAKADYLPYGVDFPKGPTGRFTNGRTVADYIAEFLGLPYPPPAISFKTSNITTGLNYASASCGILPETGSHDGKCLNLGDQVSLFEDGILNDLPELFKGSDDFSRYLSKSILVLAIGSNDYLSNYHNSLFDTSRTYTPQQFAKLLIDSLSQHLERLYKTGARKFLMFEIGPIGCIPSVAHQKRHNGTCVEESNLLVSYFNAMLQPMLQNITSSLAGSKFVLGRAYWLAYDAVINPSRYGLIDSNNPCCKTWGINGPSTCIPLVTSCPNADKYYFWDGYHLTDVLYSLLASRCIKDPMVCSPTIEELVKI